MASNRKRKIKKSFLKRFMTPRYRFERFEYYANFNVISHFIDLKKILIPEDLEIVHTKSAITFRGIPFASLIAGVIDKLGKPRFTIDNSSTIKGHKILFYKEKVGSVSVRIQLHFLREKLFYANYAFDPQKMGGRLKDEIFSILSDKYLQEEITEWSKKMIVDDYDNKIIVKDQALFEIGYISGNDYFKAYLRENKELENENRDKTVRVRLQNLFLDI